MSNANRTLYAVIVLLAASCSGGGGSGGDGAPALGTTASRDTYAQRLAEWLCDDLAACCEGTQSIDRETCVAVKKASELHRVAREEEHSGRTFDAAMAATCIDLLDATPAGCGAERRVSECFRTYDGVRELGEACSFKSQCRGSLRGDVACVAGVCTTRLAAGEACAELAQDAGRCDVCRADARCREAADGNHYCYGYARRRGVAGDPCRRDFALPADPTEASLVADCEREDGLYCSASGVCAPFASTGGACTTSFPCGPGARCAGGLCAPGLAAGDTCAGLAECGPGLYCRWTDYVCTDPDPTPSCDSYELLSGTCSAPVGAGEACGDFVDCAQGLGCDRPGGGDGVCVDASLCTSGLARLQRQSP